MNQTKAQQSSPPDNGTSPTPFYDENFKVSGDYKLSLPDAQNADKNSIKGANVAISQVGIHNFKLPLKFLRGDGTVCTLQASITATVSLSADCKGINMSRIMRVFYLFADEVFTPDTLKTVLEKMKEKLKTSRAHLHIRFEYPLEQTSLRSGHKAWQYYSCVYEGTIDAQNVFKKIIHFDFIYSSACPCSAELSEHARRTRNVYCVPHSQRSKARVRAHVLEGEKLTIEDMHAHCLSALKTETQTIVRREDEQAFAELNGAYAKFIEDAARLLYDEFNADKRIADFEIACIHLESLHSHDAVSVICKDVPNGFSADFYDFQDLLC